MKILEVNGLKYSRERFESYLRRAIVIFEKEGETHKLDIYTTDVSKSNLIDTLISRMKEGVSFVKLDHWCTKEQDDSTNKLLQEWVLSDSE